MKLEIKHLAPYLPYDIKVTKGDWNKTFTMNSDGLGFNRVGVEDILHFQAKPILYPLSSLTKEIEFDGEMIKPIDYISTSIKDAQKTMRRVANELPLDTLEYWKIERLCKLHFDVFNLIPNGLAIDKTTL